jgi:hypothetical protein
MLKFVLVFGGTGGLLLWTAATRSAESAAWWALAYPAASCLLVAAAYAVRSPRLFGKRHDGSMGGLRWLLFLPFQIITAVTHRIESGMGRYAAWNEVAPGLYVGRRPRGAHELPDGLTRVLDLTCEFAEHPAIRALPGYRAMPVLDASVPPLADLTALINEVAADPAPLLVHCAQGRGRSAAVMCAILVARGVEPDIALALARIRAARPVVRLHAAQRSRLDAWAASTRG